MKLKKLDQLKEKLQKETDLSKIWLYSAASNIAKYSRFTGIAKSDRNDRN